MNPRLIYQALLLRFGPQRWWPARTPLEVCLGAILTQNTNWANVENALGVLRRETSLEFGPLLALPVERLAELIRPTGYFNQKARRLRGWLEWLDTRAGGELSALSTTPTAGLRQELLALRGIGPETADSILCYALGRPVFVVDAYTRRAARRHGWIEEKTSYDDLAALFARAFPGQTARLNELHALFVRLGKEHCRKSKPGCARCPLVALR